MSYFSFFYIGSDALPHLPMPPGYHFSRKSTAAESFSILHQNAAALHITLLHQNHINTVFCITLCSLYCFVYPLFSFIFLIFFLYLSIFISFFIFFFFIHLVLPVFLHLFLFLWARQRVSVAGRRGLGAAAGCMAGKLYAQRGQ